MRQTRRRLLQTTGVALGGVGLAGCGGRSGTDADESAADTETATDAADPEDVGDGVLGGEADGDVRPRYRGETSSPHSESAGERRRRHGSDASGRRRQRGRH
ncbi:hypothetical protein DU504_13060 [Haloplanus salinus]|uniref:Uncharacterized protein n=1 Tax=Haloplanus salinus TaxID=1126245 RepID=A0A368NFN5_9EURY|nr:hypothetical protein [Haloplanus salinus]RCU48149.1 hypothetical protein DU504_13060 [Haloplanus salinus]